MSGAERAAQAAPGAVPAARFASLIGLCLTGLSCGPGPGAPRVQLEAPVAKVYPALVRLEVVTTRASGGRLMKFRAGGSGVIIRPDGYVVTNHHVAGKATRIVCRLSDREEIEADLVATDPLTDIAVLKLRLDQRESGAPLPAATFGDSDAVRMGDVVLAMGSPAGLSQSVTRGVVSNTEMILPRGTLRLDGEPVGLLVRWIGHDAEIFSGNSGGPLVNLDGEIIGINEVGIGSLGGAIPADLVRSVARQLIASGEVRRSWTGLECQPLLPDGPAERGVLVGGVIDDSPAEQAGFRPGDVITHFDGRAVHAAFAEELPLFYRVVLSTPVGKEVPVRAIRDGEAKRFRLVTAARQPSRGADVELSRWGITCRDFTRLSALEHGRPHQSGVLVRTVRPGGPCAEAEPPIGGGDVITHVNGQAVADVAKLRAATRELLGGDDDRRIPVLAGFDRGSEKYLTVVRVGAQEEEEAPRRARKAWLAVRTQVLTRELAEEMGLEDATGVRVTQVYPGRSAEESGLKVGDLIVRLDGQPIDASRPEDAGLFAYKIRRYEIGAEVELGVIRDGERRKITVTLEQPPTPAEELDRYEDEDFEFAARNMSFEDRVSKSVETRPPSVLVAGVDRAGWADLAGLHAGDILVSIDGQRTPDVQKLETILRAANKRQAERRVFFVRRGVHTMFLVLQPDWDEQE